MHRPNLLKRLICLGFTLSVLLSAVPLNATADGEIQLVDEDNFTLLWTSDPQWYSFAYPEILEHQNQWVVDNKERLDIRYVIHTGDFVEFAA